MTPFQKIIKYGALAFATYLCVMIIGGIILGLTSLFGIFIGIDAWENSNNNQIEQSDVNVFTENININKLDIKLGVCKLEIKKGTSIKVEISNSYKEIESEVQGTTLKIKDKTSPSWFNQMNNTPTVILTLPQTQEFEEVSIKLGVNDTKIEYLKADKIEIEAGIGKTIINNLISKKAKLKGGTGETNILSSSFDTLKMEAGIGKFDITTKIEEEANISSGIGKLDLNLQGKKEDYKINGKTGLGNLKINNQNIRDNETYGNGDINIDVKSGIGKTTIDFIEEI